MSPQFKETLAYLREQTPHKLVDTQPIPTPGSQEETYLLLMGYRPSYIGTYWCLWDKV